VPKPPPGEHRDQLSLKQNWGVPLQTWPAKRWVKSRGRPVPLDRGDPKAIVNLTPGTAALAGWTKAFSLGVSS
jgi:hypothetical protein